MTLRLGFAADRARSALLDPNPAPPPSRAGSVQARPATAGANEGTIDLTWDPTGTEVKSYSIELSTVAGIGPWTLSRTVTKSSATVDGLTSGQRVWFRVVAVGAAGQGSWSDPATKIVP